MPVMGCVWQEEVFMKKQTLLERTAAQVRMGQTEERTALERTALERTAPGGK